MTSLSALFRARDFLSRTFPHRFLSSSPFAAANSRTRANLPPPDACAPYSAPDERHIYPKRKSPHKRAGALIDALHAEEVASLVAQGRAAMPIAAPNLRSGDIVRVQYVAALGQAKSQYFTGVCIAFKRRGTGSSFVLRNVLEGVAVERSWPYYSPCIVGAEIVGKKKGVNRNKLWYLRDKPLKESTVGSATSRPKAT